LALGLASALGRRSLGLDELTRSRLFWPDPAPAFVLIFWDRLWWPALALDAEAWRTALADLEALVALLVQDLSAGRVSALILDDGEHWRFTVTRWGLRRLWRRGGGLRELMRPAP
jgi:hypothetical protein